MPLTTIWTEILIGTTALVTFLGFQRVAVFERYLFSPKRILADKQWERLLTAGFLHADWMHFGFNMFSFYFFGRNLEIFFGGTALLVIYLGSIVGGDLLALYFHRNHDYTLIGASAGVCGVIFATLFLLPGMEIQLFPLPVGIPTWLYALIFLGATYVGVKKKGDGVGHEAHLGGAVCGVLLAVAMFPANVLQQRYLLVSFLALAGTLLWLLVRNPKLDASQLFGRREARSKAAPLGRHRDYDFFEAAGEARTEIDAILEKISQRGFQSLSAAERAKLEQYSRKKRR
ncbi:MAG: rhomboid family intramembrane serine protease [Opitutaceae bacterium]